jgi:uncharacterized OsmC-like protein
MNASIAKQWSVSALSSAKDPLRLFCGGRPLTQNASATIDGVSPVEFLLISVATCFALSCRAALIPRKLSDAAFEVTAVGTKALDAPSRMNLIEVSVKFGSDIPEAVVAKVAEEAKLMCTVTNTILGTPTVTIGARSSPA